MNKVDWESLERLQNRIEKRIHKRLTRENRPGLQAWLLDEFRLRAEAETELDITLGKDGWTELEVLKLYLDELSTGERGLHGRLLPDLIMALFAELRLFEAAKAFEDGNKRAGSVAMCDAEAAIAFAENRAKEKKKGRRAKYFPGPKGVRLVIPTEPERRDKSVRRDSVKWAALYHLMTKAWNSGGCELRGLRKHPRERLSKVTSLWDSVHREMEQTGTDVQESVGDELQTVLNRWMRSFACPSRLSPSYRLWAYEHRDALRDTFTNESDTGFAKGSKQDRMRF